MGDGHDEVPPSSMSSSRISLRGSDYLALATGNPRRLAVRINPGAAGPAPLRSFDPTEKQRVLLTGATGYVGMHILHRLLDDDRVERVHVVLREHARHSLEQRLDNAVRPYRLPLSNRHKLRFVAGDISQPRLMISEPRWSALADEATMIIHSASSTNHAYPYAFYRATSIRALLDLADLSISGRRKQLHIIGSVGCEAFQSWRDFYRFDFYRCGYTRMKWIVKHLAAALNDKGVLAYAYMLPFVLGSSVTNYKDPGMHYAFWQMIKAVKDVGQVWDSRDALIPVIPALTLADAIIGNAFSAKPSVWTFPTLSMDGKDLAAALNVPGAPWTDFRRALTRSAPFLPAKLRHLADLPRLRLTVQKALFIRGLFPKDFPRIMNATSDVSRSVIMP